MSAKIEIDPIAIGDSVIDLVSGEFPRCVRGIFNPQEMREKGSASCFGSVVMVAAGLSVEGVNTDGLHLLIARNHAAVSSLNGRPVNGHALLAHADGDVSRLYDAVLVQAGEGELLRLNNAVSKVVARDLTAETTWLQRDEYDGAVIDVVKLEEACGSHDETGRAALIAEGPSAQYKQFFVFDSYPLEEGIDVYQADHSVFRKRLPVTLSDFAAVYEQIKAETS